ncbi:MAG: hypothetical protein OEW15_04455 [Nitrospirota bacterium]|nr:hypothetical protein [Nitrospirota bacterium]
MRHATFIGLLIVLVTASTAYGEKKNPASAADILAKEVSSKIICRKSNVEARADACRLHIHFEKMNAAFDLPLQGTIVSPSDAEDAVVVKNTNMTRSINGNAPESFEQLTLRFQKDMVGPMLKTFNDAIAICNTIRPMATRN